ncbi:calcium/sodium antiporter [bacterium]|nr:calcium/sodium antiporter [bacterium]
MTTILFFILGLGLLIAGAELLVRGASHLAALIGISPLIIGLTVVAFGTSSPELAVSLKSALSLQDGIAVGNVVGSNIFNILLILGISALIVPLGISRQLIRYDVPLMILASVLVLWWGFDGRISRFEGLLLFCGLIAYLLLLTLLNRKETSHSIADQDEQHTTIPATHNRKKYVVQYLFFVVAGLGLLWLGSHWLVESSVVVARYLGVNELIIGLTIVAGGTSLPEVVTSIVASIRHERDIAVGNVVGSNLFNILGVLGIAGLVSPVGLEITPPALHFDIPVMIAVAIICFPIFFTGLTISRWEGALFLAYYGAYLLYLFLGAIQHAYFPDYHFILVCIIAPLTGLTLLFTTIREMMTRHHRINTSS